VPDPFYLLVLGDSVTWGQGLRDEEKLHSLVLEPYRRRGPTRALMLAHSGAIIGRDTALSRPVCHPEVPKAYPTIWQQCDAAPDTDVDLVILNGGINDIDIRFILNPFTDRRELADVTRLFCGQHLEWLIARVLARFPRARVAVTSYYPILSEQSDLDLVPDFTFVEGMPIRPYFDLFSPGPVLQKVITNCRIFYEESTAAMRDAVAALAATGRVFFAAPPFGPANAALAPDPWLFGLTWPGLEPEDPVAAERRAACRRCESDLLQREQCYRASAGHPNREGAREFAREILGKLKDKK